MSEADTNEVSGVHRDTAVNSDDARSRVSNPWTVFIVICACVVFAQVVFAFAVLELFQGEAAWQQRGAFGDMFGALGSLFSGVAMAGVICAIIMQSQELALQRAELRLQREELHATREELKRSATAQENSEKVLELQVSALAAAAQVTAASALSQIEHDAFYQHGSGDSSARGEADKLKLHVRTALARLDHAIDEWKSKRAVAKQNP